MKEEQMIKEIPYKVKIALGIGVGALLLIAIILGIVFAIQGKNKNKEADIGATTESATTETVKLLSPKEVESCVQKFIKEYDEVSWTVLGEQKDVSNTYSLDALFQWREEWPFLIMRGTYIPEGEAETIPIYNFYCVDRRDGTLRRYMTIPAGVKSLGKDVIIYLNADGICFEDSVTGSFYLEIFTDSSITEKTLSEEEFTNLKQEGLVAKFQSIWERKPETEPESESEPESEQEQKPEKEPEPETESESEPEPEPESTESDKNYVSTDPNDPYREIRGYWTDHLGCAGNDNHIFESTDCYNEKHPPVYGQAGSYVNEYLGFQIDSWEGAGRLDNDQELKINRSYLDGSYMLKDLVSLRLRAGTGVSVWIHEKGEGDYASPEAYMKKSYIITWDAPEECFSEKTLGNNTYYTFDPLSYHSETQYMMLFARESRGYLYIINIYAHDQAEAYEVMKLIH